MGWDGWDLSQTATTIRAPLAVLINTTYMHIHSKGNLRVWTSDEELLKGVKVEPFSFWLRGVQFNFM